MTADKGLAGAFNANVIRAAETFARESERRRWYTRSATRRATRCAAPARWTSRRGRLAASKLDVAREVAAAVTDDFVRRTHLGGRADLTEARLDDVAAPADAHARCRSRPAEATTQRDGRADAVEFAPSPESVLSRLLPKYLEFTIYSAMLETDAAFFAAQLVAMSNATDNASKLIDELTIAMNNARQAAITKEMLEIVAGAEALGG